jgi:hypothetical protein
MKCSGIWTTNITHKIAYTGKGAGFGKKDVKDVAVDCGAFTL